MNTVELEIRPIPPDTVSSVRESFDEIVDAALAETGQTDLRRGGGVAVDLEQPFPGSEILIAIVSGIAIETFKEVVLPVLKRRLSIQERPETRSGTQTKD